MGYRTAEVKNESGMKVRLSPQQLEFVQLFLTKKIVQIDINMAVLQDNYFLGLCVLWPCL